MRSSQNNAEWALKTTAGAHHQTGEELRIVDESSGASIHQEVGHEMVSGPGHQSRSIEKYVEGVAPNDSRLLGACSSETIPPRVLDSTGKVALEPDIAVVF